MNWESDAFVEIMDSWAPSISKRKKDSKRERITINQALTDNNFTRRLKPHHLNMMLGIKL